MLHAYSGQELTLNVFLDHLFLSRHSRSQLWVDWLTDWLLSLPSPKITGMCLHGCWGGGKPRPSCMRSTLLTKPSPLLQALILIRSPTLSLSKKTSFLPWSFSSENRYSLLCGCWRGHSPSAKKCQNHRCYKMRTFEEFLKIHLCLECCVLCLYKILRSALGRHPVDKHSCTPAELEYLHGTKTTKRP